MLKRTITYNDFNDVERTEDFYFNLSKSEITELNLRIPGGLVSWVQTISQALDGNAIMDIFKDLLLKSYGEKSPDGKRFRKVDDNDVPLSIAFSETNAYDQIFMELVTNPKKAEEFFNAVVPKEDLTVNK